MYNKFFDKSKLSKFFVLVFIFVLALSNIFPVILSVLLESNKKVYAQTQSGLLVYWPFNETSGDTVFDASGNNNNGRLMNGVTRITEGKVGRALSFDGVDDYVEGVDIDFPSGPFTISVWFKTDYTGSNALRITDKTSGWTNINWEIFRDINGNIAGGLYDGGYQYVIDNRRTYNDNQWHLVTLVVDSSKIELFVDGTSAGTKSHDNSFPTNNTLFAVGKSSFFSSTNWKGQIDEFRIYNRSLSAQEVLSLYNEASGGGTTDTQPPSTPTGLSATPISSSQINLSWTASTDNVGVAGYKVYRCQGTGCAPTTQIATTTTNTFQNTGLSPSTSYSYAVSAFDAAGNNSSLSQVASATTPQQVATTTTISINPSITYQTMTGWEAHVQSGQEHSSFPLYKDKLFDLAVNDLGLNRLRLEVRSGVENTTDYWTLYRSGQINDSLWRCYRYSTINDNSDHNSINWSGFKFSELDFQIDNVVLPFKQRVEARGEKFHLNLEYVAFTSQMTATGCPSGLQYIHTDPNEYAEFILATTLHLKNKYNIVPDSWEVILEPDNTSFWRGTQIGQAILATAAKLQANGFNPKFITPSTADMGHGWIYFDNIVSSVPQAVNYITELSYHRYGGVTLSNLQTIAQRAKQYGIKTAMLEHIGSGYQDLHDDLKIGNNSAWQQFTLAFPGTSDDGGAYYKIDTTNPSNPIINIGGRTKFLRQYFKYIRYGAVRVEANSNNSNFDPLVFRNTNGSYVVVVKANAGGSFSISGLPAGNYGIFYTTGDGLNASQYDVNLPDTTIASGGTITTSIPSSGVITIYAKTSAPPPSDTQPPSTPTGLSATPISSSQINLSWTASTDNVGVAGYKVYRCQGTGCAPTTQIATTTTNTFQNTGLSPSTSYSYAVSAFDAAGNNSLLSQPASATTPSQPSGQLSGLQVLGTTHMQAIISYIPPDNNACKIEVSESPTFRPLIHDVNPNLFVGADSDLNRALTDGSRRILVIGKRNSDTAQDGRLYSRALAVYTTYYVRVTCGNQQATVQFTTTNLPWGDASSEPPPYNPDGFGFYGWPTIDWSNRDAEYIDPMTGVRIRLLGWPGYTGARRGEANIAPDLWWDWQGVWLNAQNIRSGNTSALASINNANAPIFVGIEPNPGVNIPWEQSGYGHYGIDTTIDDLGLRIFGSGTDANASNRQIQVCLSMDSGQNCYSQPITITLPQGSAIDNGIFPTSFPNPMFASWNIKPLKRGDDWPKGEGTVNVSGNIVTLTNPNSRTMFLTSWPAGTKIWISGSDPICPRNMCTITSVQSPTQLTIQQSLNLSGATYKALNFGYRIWKTTPVGTVSLSVKKVIAWSNASFMWAGGSHVFCSPVKTTTNVDRNGNPISPPKQGYLCIPLRMNGALESWAPVLWVADDGETRLISVHRFPTSIPGHLPEDNPAPGALGPSSLYARFDPNNGRVWYQALPTNGKDAFGAPKLSIFKVTYTGDFREYKPNYPYGGPGNAPPDNTVWENITKGSQNRDIQTQIDNSGTPGWDTTIFGHVTDLRDFEPGVFAFGKSIGSQDGPCWIFLFDLNGNFIKGFNSWDGKVYPNQRWGGCHSYMDISVPGYVNISDTNANGIGLYNPNVFLGGPFETKVTAIKRAGGWDTTNTALSPNIADGSYDADCPSDLDPRWQALGGTGKNCVQVRVQGEPCSAYATTREKTLWPCPWDSNKSTLAGNTLQEGDWLRDRGIFESESFVVARVKPIGLERELVLIRNVPGIDNEKWMSWMGGKPRCGITAAKRTHSHGWSLSPHLTGRCIGGPVFFDINKNSNISYSSDLTGHADAGVGPLPGQIAMVSGGVRYGTPQHVLTNKDPIDTFINYPSFEKAGGIGGSGLQGYPSFSHHQAQGVDRFFILDNHHIEAAGWNLSMTQVSGQKNTWRINVIGNVDIKRLALVGWVSHYLLKDISGPNSQISDATPWSFCYAYKAGECVSGSSAGQAFVSAPIIISPSTACPGFNAFGNYSGTPCIISGSPHASLTVQKLFYGDNRVRKITMAFSGHNRQGQFSRSDPSPDGKWARVPAYWLDGVRTDFLLVKLPPVNPVNATDLSKYQQVSINIPPFPGASHVLVDFGYEENGRPQDLFCTTRREKCTVPGLSPFSFESELKNPIACSSGCTTTIPGIGGRVIYYQVRYLDASQKEVGRGPLLAKVVDAFAQSYNIQLPSPDTQPPSAPTNLSATPISSSQINLSWTPSTDNVGVSEYRIERCQGTGCTNFVQVGSSQTPSYSDTGLSPNTSYNYRVRAADASNNLSGYSNVVGATTPPALSFDFSLGNIGDKSVVVGQSVTTTVVLNLISGTTQPVSLSISGLPSGATSSFSPSLCSPTCSTILTIKTATTTQIGNYLVDVSGKSGSLVKNTRFYLNVTSTPDTQPPSAPTNLSATPISSSQINLSWTPSTDNIGVSEYRIERCQGTGCTNFVQVGSSQTPSYSDTGLSPNTSYNYRVRAADASNNLSGYSNIVGIRSLGQGQVQVGPSSISPPSSQPPSPPPSSPLPSPSPPSLPQPSPFLPSQSQTQTIVLDTQAKTQTIQITISLITKIQTIIKAVENLDNESKRIILIKIKGLLLAITDLLRLIR